METLRPVLSWIDGHFDQSVQRYADFLRIPSVSTDPAYKDGIRRAAEWVNQQLGEIGFTVTIHETPLHPIVIATYEGPTSAPHILYYGHYDVQPPEPLDAWYNPPFEPTVTPSPHGHKMVARGAVDDKGQVMTAIESLRAWKSVHGDFPISLTVLIEGEEECGEPSLPAFLEKHKDQLSQPDIAVITDTEAWDIHKPAITYRLRGNIYVEVTLHGPSRDLHSGLYGGAVVNPLNILTHILGQLHDDQGRVQIPGFYDDVRELSPEERQTWKNLGFNDQEFLGDIGLTTSVGEKNYSALERIWARPTCDICGMWGGYTGVGLKGVIPTHATAKVSFRMVPDQEPQKILPEITRFFETRLPPDCRVTVKCLGASPGIEISTDNPFMTAAQKGLADIYGVAPAMVGSGGSIPVVGMFKKILGLDSVLVGFSLHDDGMHSPNEKFELTALRNGMKSHAAILEKFSAIK